MAPWFFLAIYLVGVTKSLRIIGGVFLIVIRFLCLTIQSIKIALLCGGVFDSFVVPATYLNKQLKKYQVPAWCANSCQARPGALSHCYSCWPERSAWVNHWLRPRPSQFVSLTCSATNVFTKEVKGILIYFRLSSSCWSCLASSNCCCHSWDLLYCDPRGDCWIRVWLIVAF